MKIKARASIYSTAKKYFPERENLNPHWQESILDIIVMVIRASTATWPERGPPMPLPPPPPPHRHRCRHHRRRCCLPWVDRTRLEPCKTLNLLWLDMPALA